MNCLNLVNVLRWADKSVLAYYFLQAHSYATTALDAKALHSRRLVQHQQSQIDQK